MFCVVCLQQTEPEAEQPARQASPQSAASALVKAGEQPPKRLHVSNIPFRFRDPDLRAMFGVSNLLLVNNKYEFMVCINSFCYCYFSNLGPFWMLNLFLMKEVLR